MNIERSRQFGKHGFDPLHNPFWTFLHMIATNSIIVYFMVFANDWIIHLQKNMLIDQSAQLAIGQ